MQQPTSQNIRQWTPQVDWSQLGYAAGTTPDSLDLETGLACDYVAWVTGRLLDESMPPAFERMAQKAVVLRVEQQVNLDSEEQQEALNAGQALKGFSVTGYSEQYVDPGDASKSQREGMMINPNAELNRLLWALCTPERMAWWRGFLSDGGIPAYGVVEMDWSGANRWGGYPDALGGGLPGDMPGIGSGSIDGWPVYGGWPHGSNDTIVIGGEAGVF